MADQQNGSLAFCHTNILLLSVDFLLRNTPEKIYNHQNNYTNVKQMILYTEGYISEEHTLTQ